LGSLGSTFASIGTCGKAIVAYEQSLKLAQPVGDRLGEHNSLGNLSVVYLTLNNPKKG